jgi:hypothetical protein
VEEHQGVSDVGIAIAVDRDRVRAAGEGLHPAGHGEDRDYVLSVYGAIAVVIAAKCGIRAAKAVQSGGHDRKEKENSAEQ